MRIPYLDNAEIVVRFARKSYIMRHNGKVLPTAFALRSYPPPKQDEGYISVNIWQYKGFCPSAAVSPIKSIGFIALSVGEIRAIKKTRYNIDVWHRPTLGNESHAGIGVMSQGVIVRGEKLELQFMDAMQNLAEISSFFPF